MAGRFSVEAIFKAVDRMTGPINKMQARVGKMTKAFKTELEGVTKAGDMLFTGLKTTAIAGAAALGIVGVALGNVSDRADDLLMRSQRLNFPIESLQEWQFVAEQTGLTVDEFDTALDKFSKTLGAAKLGSGALASTLKKSNPPLLRQLMATKDNAQAFEIYLESLRKIPDANKRNALAAAAFGKSGDKLTNIVTESTASIKALRLEAQQNGIMTLEQAKAAEAYGDAMNSFKRAGMGLLQSALLPLMPVLTDALGVAREWVIANRQIISEKVTAFFTFLVNNFADIVKWGKRILIVVGVFMALMGVLKTLVTILTLVNLVMAANPITLITIGVIALIAAVAMLIAYFDEFASAFANLGPVMQIILSPVMGLIVALKLLWEIAYALANALVGNFEPVAAFWEGLVGTIGNVLKMMGRVTGISAAINSLFGGGDNEQQAAGSTAGAAQVVSPQDRAAQAIEESRSTSTAEVTIRDETGRAQMKTSGRSPGASVQLKPSGAF